MTAFAPSSRALSIMRSIAWRRLSSSSAVYWGTSPWRSAVRLAVKDFATPMLRTTRPNVSPRSRSTVMPSSPRAVVTGKVAGEDSDMTIIIGKKTPAADPQPDQAVLFLYHARWSVTGDDRGDWQVEPAPGKHCATCRMLMRAGRECVAGLAERRLRAVAQRAVGGAGRGRGALPDRPGLGEGPGEGIAGVGDRQHRPMPDALEDDHPAVRQRYRRTAGQADVGARPVGGQPAVHLAGQAERVHPPALCAQLRTATQGAAAAMDGATGAVGAADDAALEVGEQQIAAAVACLHGAVAIPVPEWGEPAADMERPRRGHEHDQEQQDEQDQQHPQPDELAAARGPRRGAAAGAGLKRATPHYVLPMVSTTVQPRRAAACAAWAARRPGTTVSTGEQSPSGRTASGAMEWSPITSARPCSVLISPPLAPPPPAPPLAPPPGQGSGTGCRPAGRRHRRRSGARCARVRRCARRAGRP